MRSGSRGRGKKQSDPITKSQQSEKEAVGCLERHASNSLTDLVSASFPHRRVATCRSTSSELLRERLTKARSNTVAAPSVATTKAAERRHATVAASATPAPSSTIRDSLVQMLKAARVCDSMKAAGRHKTCPVLMSNRASSSRSAHVRLARKETDTSSSGRPKTSICGETEPSMANKCHISCYKV